MAERAEDKEQGRFEGRVLESLANICSDVIEIKQATLNNSSEIEGLKIGQAVHKEEHKRIEREIDKAKRQNGNGENNSRGDAIRIIIPSAALIVILQGVSEILKRVFGW